MQLTCKECGVIFNSVIIEAPKAAMEVGEKFMQHLLEKHNAKAVETFQTAAVVNSIANWLFMVKQLGSGFDDRLIAQIKVQQEAILDKLEILQPAVREEVN